MCLECQADGQALEEFTQKVDDILDLPLTCDVFKMIHLIIILTE